MTALDHVPPEWRKQVEAVVRAAPRLTDEQRSGLAPLLRPPAPRRTTDHSNDDDTRKAS